MLFSSICFDSYPILQDTPSLYTGTLLVPPFATLDPNVVTLESVTNALAPAPTDAATGNELAVNTPVLTTPDAVTVTAVTLLTQVSFHRLSTDPKL
jgi:hypothetical protein